MMHHHKLEHLVKKIVLLSSRSKSQWRPITVSVISSELLILLQPSLVWSDIIAILSSELLILLQPSLVWSDIIAILSSELLILPQPNLVSWYIIAILSSELLILLQPNLVWWYIFAGQGDRQTCLLSCPSASACCYFCLAIFLLMVHAPDFFFSRNSSVFFIKTVCYVRDQLLCMDLFRRW